MNAKLLYAATIAIALLGSSAAMATEATQIIVPAGTATRAAVQAELAQAKASGYVHLLRVLSGPRADRSGLAIRCAPSPG